MVCAVEIIALYCCVFVFLRVYMQFQTAFEDLLIIGYGCHLEVGNGVHKVTHSDGIMSVLLYGFHNGPNRGYGYPVGVRLNPTDRGSYL